uniref:Uncharacterized protein n=1 Tax=Romanomermis culicivorax TaxID=13658 RepID=A0A915HU82_ROMCU
TLQKLIKFFQGLSRSNQNNDQQLRIADFENIFNGNEQVASYLFEIFKCEKVSGSLPEKKQFINLFRPFFDQDVKQIINHFMISDDKSPETERISKLIICCSAAAGVPLNNISDKHILTSFVQNVVLQSNNGCPIDIESCVANTCSQMVGHLNQFIIHTLRKNDIMKHIKMPLQSVLLSPFLSWLLLSQVPQVYFSRSSSNGPPLLDVSVDIDLC